ncbi:protein of unknown function [Azospirillum baldaniorum]|uniref:Uncharacterized protein n=1 Tax=Azospirillum baldaniorum TaxID=1064539 RepID=A0A9P1JR42_9PROT|nr:protein of unknown function [Azospirillum baldaniorum]
MGRVGLPPGSPGGNAAGVPGFQAILARDGAWRGRTGIFRRARLFYNPGCAFGALLR